MAAVTVIIIGKIAIGMMPVEQMSQASGIGFSIGARSPGVGDAARVRTTLGRGLKQACKVISLAAIILLVAAEMASGSGGGLAGDGRAVAVLAAATVAGLGLAIVLGRTRNAEASITGSENATNGNSDSRGLPAGARRAKEGANRKTSGSRAVTAISGINGSGVNGQGGSGSLTAKTTVKKPSFSERFRAFAASIIRRIKDFVVYYSRAPNALVEGFVSKFRINNLIPNLEAWVVDHVRNVLRSLLNPCVTEKIIKGKLIKLLSSIQESIARIKKSEQYRHTLFMLKYWLAPLIALLTGNYRQYRRVRRIIKAMTKGTTIKRVIIHIRNVNCSVACGSHFIKASELSPWAMLVFDNAGTIELLRFLLEKLGDDDIAWVIGHEIGHAMDMSLLGYWLISQLVEDEYRYQDCIRNKQTDPLYEFHFTFNREDIERHRQKESYSWQLLRKRIRILYERGFSRQRAKEKISQNWELAKDIWAVGFMLRAGFNPANALGIQHRIDEVSHKARELGHKTAWNRPEPKPDYETHPSDNIRERVLRREAKRAARRGARKTDKPASDMGGGYGLPNILRDLERDLENGVSLKKALREALNKLRGDLRGGLYRGQRLSFIRDFLTVLMKASLKSHQARAPNAKARRFVSFLFSTPKNKKLVIPGLSRSLRIPILGLIIASIFNDLAHKKDGTLNLWGRLVQTATGGTPHQKIERASRWVGEVLGYAFGCSRRSIKKVIKETQVKAYLDAQTCAGNGHVQIGIDRDVKAVEDAVDLFKKIASELGHRFHQVLRQGDVLGKTVAGSVAEAFDAVGRVIIAGRLGKKHLLKELEDLAKLARLGKYLIDACETLGIDPSRLEDPQNREENKRVINYVAVLILRDNPSMTKEQLEKEMLEITHDFFNAASQGAAHLTGAWIITYLANELGLSWSEIARLMGRALEDDTIDMTSLRAFIRNLSELAKREKYNRASITQLLRSIRGFWFSLLIWTTAQFAHLLNIIKTAFVAGGTCLFFLTGSPRDAARDAAEGAFGTGSFASAKNKEVILPGFKKHIPIFKVGESSHFELDIIINKRKMPILLILAVISLLFVLDTPMPEVQLSLLESIIQFLETVCALMIITLGAFAVSAGIFITCGIILLVRNWDKIKSKVVNTIVNNWDKIKSEVVNTVKAIPMAARILVQLLYDSTLAPVSFVSSRPSIRSMIKKIVLSL
ncbi:MAG: hypothetical protein FJZ11_03990, partial [Candidatus Omnitrophica bacterium]|nr:hypothetical protein [Candidatus Omnitrophota bacterium]